MANDWRDDAEPSARERGRHQADRHCGQPLDALVRALHDALRERDGLRGSLFPSKERQFLDGFIGRLQEELERRSRDVLDLPEFAEEPMPPLAETSPSARPSERPAIGPADRPAPPHARHDAPDFLFDRLPDTPATPRRPPGDAATASWSGPDFLFTGVPEPGPSARRRTDTAGEIPAELEGLGDLFSGWTEGLDRPTPAAPARPVTAADPPAVDFPERLLLEIPEGDPRSRRSASPGPLAGTGGDTLPPPALHWVEPEVPRIPLRTRLHLAWSRFIDRLYYRPPRDQDWDL